MTYNNEGTGAINGMLTAIYYHCKYFGVSSPLFAFDSRKNFRKEISPGYKLKVYKDDKDKEERLEIFNQIKIIRKIILPTMGFKNVFQQTGIEADDILATLVRNNPNKVIVLTGDEDLLQLVDECSWFSPKTKVLMNEISFRKKYGIAPRDWKQVKQLAGCSSDKVKGIVGIGEATALKYLTGTLKKESVAYQIIEAERKDMRRKNGILVNLPFPKTKPVEIQEDEFSKEGFLAICDMYGLEKLAEKADDWQLMFR